MKTDKIAPEAPVRASRGSGVGLTAERPKLIPTRLSSQDKIVRKIVRAIERPNGDFLCVAVETNVSSGRRWGRLSIRFERDGETFPAKGSIRLDASDLVPLLEAIYRLDIELKTGGQQ